MGSPIVAASRMKRSFALCLAVCAVLGVFACGSPPETPAGAEAATNGWVAGPRVDGVARVGDAIVVSGLGAPFGRIVLTGPDGVAYAASADETGHFDIRLPAPKRDALLVVEAQVGQIAYPAPGRLLVSADPRGPVALLGIGAPTRRLDTAGPLDAVDTDGRAGFLSGRAGAGSAVAVGRSGGGTVTSGEDGRWTLLVSGEVAAPVQVGERVFTPPAMVVATDGVLERAGEGWRLGWTSTDGARQVTWFPDGTAP